MLPGFDEVLRRDSIKDELDEHALNPRPFNVSTFSGGSHVLLTLGTAILAPRSDNRLRPSMRIYGAFDSKEDAIEHAQVVRELDPHCSLIVATMGEWLLFPQESTSLEADENQKRIEMRLRDLHEERCSANENFKRMVRNHEDPYENHEGTDNAVDDDARCLLRPPLV